MRGVDKRKPALSGLLVAHECVDQKAGYDWHQPIQHAANVPDPGVKATPIRHVGMQAMAELCDLAIIRLRVLPDELPAARYFADCQLHTDRNSCVDQGRRPILICRILLRYFPFGSYYLKYNFFSDSFRLELILYYNYSKYL